MHISKLFRPELFAIVIANAKRHHSSTVKTPTPMPTPVVQTYTYITMVPVNTPTYDPLQDTNTVNIGGAGRVTVTAFIPGPTVTVSYTAIIRGTQIPNWSLPVTTSENFATPTYATSSISSAPITVTSTSRYTKKGAKSKSVSDDGSNQADGSGSDSGSDSGGDSGSDSDSSTTPADDTGHDPYIYSFSKYTPQYPMTTKKHRFF